MEHDIYQLDLKILEMMMKLIKQKLIIWILIGRIMIIKI